MRKKEIGKVNNKTSISMILLLVFIVMVVTNINACGFFGIFGHASWKEEVLLHDGSKIIVKRWQKRGGLHKLDKGPLIEEYSISFKLPDKKETITWKDGPTKDIGRANFELVALHIKNNTPYLITTTYGCLAFNKWGRPNPSYVIFKLEGYEWKRIALTELPLEFKDVNLVIDTINDEKIIAGQSLITAEKVKELNGSLTQEIYKTIVRIPVKQIGPEGCSEMIYDGRGWTGLDKFKNQVSYMTCLDQCKKYIFDAQYCPCSRLFKTNTKEK